MFLISNNISKRKMSEKYTENSRQKEFNKEKNPNENKSFDNLHQIKTLIITV